MFGRRIVAQHSTAAGRGMAAQDRTRRREPELGLGTGPDRTGEDDKSFKKAV